MGRDRSTELLHTDREDPDNGIGRSLSLLAVNSQSVLHSHPSSVMLLRPGGGGGEKHNEQAIDAAASAVTYDRSLLRPVSCSRNVDATQSPPVSPRARALWKPLRRASYDEQTLSAAVSPIPAVQSSLSLSLSLSLLCATTNRRPDLSLSCGMTGKAMESRRFRTTGSVSVR